jgi:diazepam-binding inhibitor (GABA receptor modulator, acyl-CoA-binding protein)
MINSKEFVTATEYVKKLKSSPINEELLMLYKYYKQATVGDNNTQKPMLLNFKAMAKWNAWNTVKDTTTHDSEIEYIKLVNQMIKKYGFN